eukprot:CAMPEP_0201640336 /NCGR_PEP_ID=MMETSP0493-20130528/21555_1 /ASSEMBLY_ACC=CAM_ASM_000838 /TAXON_ID=420259 /ORGANISM="Thalassiosira gravida, Strain GMp14c1" /LENGTH=40 /DNA_ID= /DNA_START= /DNA_END= /DNA_ORIENTATION=
MDDTLSASFTTRVKPYFLSHNEATKTKKNVTMPRSRRWVR